MVLEDTSERRILHVPRKNLKNKTKKAGEASDGTTIDDDEVCCYYTDIRLGLYLVRGDSMVLMGEVDTEDENGEDDIQDEGEGVQQQEGLTGSGLLMGSVFAPERKKTFMKKVTLEQFEEFEEKIKKSADGDMDDLTWEFDLDLVV
jgi:hypothetical protein